MKRIAQILIIMSLLLVSTFIPNVNSSSVTTINHLKNETTQSISVNQLEGSFEVLSRPYLDAVFNSSSSSLLTVTRDRNDSLGHGAIHEMEIYQNVTVQYKVVNGDENTTVRLHLDAPAVNFTATQTDYSLDLASNNVNESLVMKYVSSSTDLENITLPYDKDFGELVNVNISTYEVEFNITSNFIRYFGAVDASNHETLGNAPFNFITTQQYWTTKSVDEFYIQTEVADINILANNTSAADVYGIAYRTSPTDQFTRVNYTTPVTTPLFDENITLPEFNLGVTVEWFSYAYLNEVLNGTPILKIVERTEFKRVKMEDGTPSLFTEINSQHKDKLLVDNTLYTQSNNVNISISATVVKGHIDSFNLTFGDNSSLMPLDNVNDPTGNISREGEFFNFTQNFEAGRHDIFLAAFTDKGIEINATYVLFIDQTAPTVSLKEEFDQSQVISTSGKVTFEFDFSDELSGVREAILDLGDGKSVEVTDKNEYTHRYLEFRIGYLVTLTIVDFAGNVVISETLQIKVIPEPIGDTDAPNAEFWLLLLFVVIGIVAYKFREKISDILGR
ncbi:MAG: hypothetical protein HeimC2_18720 [Candidatus Heimdallarchaeota archaeon LC_2]|nr:MAG: hypothetical protein HeimC2_18720 [Candidatus Heimdallarchaeota archaeon LC_2]